MKYIFMAVYAFIIFYAFEIYYPDRNILRAIIVGGLLLGGCYVIDNIANKRTKNK